MNLAIMLVVVVAIGTAFLGLVSCNQVRDDCERSCGNVNIPFPWGFKEGCYYEKAFLVTCNNNSMPYLGPKENVNIRSINTDISEVEVTATVSYDCGYKSSADTRNRKVRLRQRVMSSFTFSAKNRFVAVGCNAEAYVKGRNENDEISVTGCVSTCDSISDITNGSCSGVGCCEVEIPKGMGLSSITVLSSYENLEEGITREWNPCSYAFIVQQGKYMFNSTDLLDNFGGKSMMMPQIFDWDIGNQTCGMVNKESDDFLCKGNSTCDQDYVGPGYRCHCLAGFQGNPYIKDNCTNIDECKAGTHNCKGECKDLQGNYTCPCPNGDPGEYRIDNNTCSANELPIIQISVGTSVAGLFLILLFTWIYFWLKRRNKLILREKFFRQNGGILLQQRISADGGSQIQAKLFTVEELEKATNNYDESTIIGKGGFGTVFKGVLPDDTTVAIKKSKIVDPDQTQVEQFINEVVIVSQINHRNVVKLIGCCLETEVPSLVYEFIPNGTLFDHIHEYASPRLLPGTSDLK